MSVTWMDPSSTFIKPTYMRPFQEHFFQLEHIASRWLTVFFFSFSIGYCGLFFWLVFPLESTADGKLVKENPYTQCAERCFLGRRPFCPRRLSCSWTLAGRYLVTEQGISNTQVSWFLLQALTFVLWIYYGTSGESQETSPDGHFPQAWCIVNTASHPRDIVKLQSKEVTLLTTWYMW